MKNKLVTVAPSLLATAAALSAEFHLALGPSASLPVYSATAPHPLSSDWTEYSAPWNFDKSAYAGYANVGLLGAGVSAYVTGSSQDSGDNVHGGSATAHFRLDDLIFSKRSDPGATGVVAASANFDLSGTFAFSGTVSDRSALNHASVRVRDYSGYGVVKETGFYQIFADPSLGATTSGSFSGLPRSESFDGAFATPQRRFDLGVPQVFGLEILLAAQANTSDAELRFSSADFLHTLALRPGMPVFNLPDDYTANSSDGRIVDNIYSPSPNRVPESFGASAGWAGLLLPVFAGALLRRRSAADPKRG